MCRVSKEKRIRAYAELWPEQPRWGLRAWWAQRITGVALVAYAVWHIVTAANAPRDPASFAAMLGILHHPAVFLLMMAGLAYHGANGVRLVLFDLGWDKMRRREAFWGFIAGAALLVALASIARMASRGS
ncbi:MAG: succinate dehydrogenase, cytochrome b556 subunit [Armatimonadetes bacterium]|nr:succinate dehydrogenase, cytochrome b556 subunit [Armatimonadota bacterium]